MNPPVDGSRDLSTLVTLARLKSAGKLKWLQARELDQLLERLQPEHRRLALALMDPAAAAPGDAEHLRIVERLAGVGS